MVKITNLIKRYGWKAAVNDISFEVNEGEVVGFLGLNGAGKTTTMNILTGYISSTAGKVEVGGFNVLENPAKAKALIGYLPETPPLYLEMKVEEYLSFVYDLKKAKARSKAAHIKEKMEQVRITNVAGRVIGHLSKGYRQRVGLAQALIGDPPVLVLDEPTVGLDPRQIYEIRQLIRELGKKHTIILSTHILPEVSAVCDRIIIIHEGRIIREDTTESLKNQAKTKNALLIIGDRDEVTAALESVLGVTQVSVSEEKSQNAYSYEVLSDRDVRGELAKAVINEGFTLLSLSSAGTLEDIFLNLTTVDSASAHSGEDAKPEDGADTLEYAGDGALADASETSETEDIEDFDETEEGEIENDDDI